jgi:hypothetical protein
VLFKILIKLTSQKWYKNTKKKIGIVIMGQKKKKKKVHTTLEKEGKNIKI